MLIRKATPQDVETLAAIHVEAWAQTYVGLLPDSEIAARDLTYRRGIWRKAVEDGATRIIVAPGQGFAQFGAQRDTALQAAGFAEELWSFYVLRPHYGTGLAQDLFQRAMGDLPFSVMVLDDNLRACGFYEKVGLRHLETRDDVVGEAPIKERVYLCDDPDLIDFRPGT